LVLASTKRRIQARCESSEKDIKVYYERSTLSID
jgi:hypothetical protein